MLPLRCRCRLNEARWRHACFTKTWWVGGHCVNYMLGIGGLSEGKCGERKGQKQKDLTIGVREVAGPTNARSGPTASVQICLFPTLCEMP